MANHPTDPTNLPTGRTPTSGGGDVVPGTTHATDHNTHAAETNAIDANVRAAHGVQPDLSSRLATGPVRVKAEYGSSGTHIATAIAGAIAQGRYEVEIEPGIWNLGTALSGLSNVALKGFGHRQTILRATGNNFCIDLAGANGARVENIFFDAASAQAAGGGAITSGATSLNNKLRNLDFGNNLHRGVWIKGGASIWFMHDFRWNGIVGSNTGIEIGDGVNLSSDIYLETFSGTAANGTAMQDWMKVLSVTDTVDISKGLFIQGQRGLTYGIGGAPTNGTFVDFTTDGMQGVGIDVQNCIELDFLVSRVSSCGSGSDVAGLVYGAGVFDCKWNGGAIQGCGRDGVLVASGAKEWEITHALIADNNTTGTLLRNGISLAAGAGRGELNHLKIGNGIRLFTPGHQKYGIDIATGTHSELTIKDIRLRDNETAPINYGQDTASTLNIIRDNAHVGPGTLTPVVTGASTIPYKGTDAMLVTVGADINGIVAGPDTASLKLIISGAGTQNINDGGNLKMAGGFAGGADDTISFEAHGGNWYETGRANN